MKKIFAYLKPHIPRMTVGLTIKFIGTIMDLLLPWILAYMIDDVVPLRNVPMILWWGAAMLFCSVLAVVTNIIANRMAARVARNTTEALRHDLFSKISYLSCAQIDEFTIPSLESRLTSDTYNIHQMIGMMQRMGVRAPILLLGGVLVTFTLEPVLTLVLVCVLPFIGYIVWRVSKKGIPLYTQLQRAVDNMVRTVRENASGIRVIKALSKTDYEKKRFADANANVVEKEKKGRYHDGADEPNDEPVFKPGPDAGYHCGGVPCQCGRNTGGKNHCVFVVLYDYPKRNAFRDAYFCDVLKGECVRPDASALCSTRRPT